MTLSRTRDPQWTREASTVLSLQEPDCHNIDHRLRFRNARWEHCTKRLASAQHPKGLFSVSRYLCCFVVRTMLRKQHH
jgi:hypothetical protein